MSETKIAKRKPLEEHGQIVQSRTPFELAAELLKTGSEIDVANLEKILIIQERYDALQAKKAYMEAMAEFKKNPPKIFKDKEVSFGTTKYNHASLGNVVEVLTEELSKYGFSASWIPKQDDNRITITCRLTHVQGHYEEATLSGPPDKSGGKNDIQAICSSSSYLERYTFLAVIGTATYDQDDDGNSAEPKPQTPMNISMEIVEQAFFNFETMHADLLGKGFSYDKDKFTKAIIKHWKKLPTGKPSKEENIKKILETIKPEEAIVEHANIPSEINN
ncbi:MAG: ERF family protein [Sedimentisphaerales bacterium]|nr:ERF family protein [Sedimentisphaerales bacterium]